MASLLRQATLGALAFLIQSPYANEAVVLTYHDMVPRRDGRALWFDCTPKELEDQLDFFQKRGASFVSIAQVEAQVRQGRRLPKNAVAITFADNYEGFYRYALPILRRRKIPVTMFVHTDFVGNRNGRPKMTWEQLKELDREGLVTIASQTRSHPADLRTLSDAQLEKEFRGSKEVLERQLGHEVPYLAYPNGKYNFRVAKAAEAAGYRLAFTEALKPINQAPNRFMIPRYVHTKYKRAWSDGH